MAPPGAAPLPDDQLGELVDAIRELAGEQLVGVGYHHKGDWRPVYRRDDFMQRFSPDQQERMAKDTIMEGLAKRVRESAWGFGELKFTISEYEEAVVIHVPFRETEGVAVGVDPLSPATLHEIAERCVEYRDLVT